MGDGAPFPSRSPPAPPFLPPSHPRQVGDFGQVETRRVLVEVWADWSASRTVRPCLASLPPFLPPSLPPSFPPFVFLLCVRPPSFSPSIPPSLGRRGLSLSLGRLLGLTNGTSCPPCLPPSLPFFVFWLCVSSLRPSGPVANRPTQISRSKQPKLILVCISLPTCYAWTCSSSHSSSLPPSLLQVLSPRREHETIPLDQWRDIRQRATQISGFNPNFFCAPLPSCYAWSSSSHSTFPPSLPPLDIFDSPRT